MRDIQPGEAYENGLLWDWKAQAYITVAEWEKRNDDGPRCSARCRKAESAKGHLSSCRRLKYLVGVGVMHPECIKRRKPSAPEGGEKA